MVTGVLFETSIQSFRKMGAAKYGRKNGRALKLPVNNEH